MIEVGLFLALTIIASLIAFASTCALAGCGEWYAKVWLPIYAVLALSWGWVICYNYSEPQYVDVVKIRDIRETTKEDGSRVQWYYSYTGQYSQLQGIFDNKEEKEVAVTKRVEQPRFGLMPSFSIKYYYDVRDKKND